MKIQVALMASILMGAQIVDAEPVTSLHRKPGLWSVTVVAEGKKGPGALSQCIDADTDARMMQMASQAGAHNCAKNELTKEGSEYQLHSECSISGSKIITQGVFKGDFDAKYEGEVISTFTPPLFGRSQSKSSISATWVGPCPEDMKPGDMALPNGMKMSLDQAQQSARMAAQMMSSPEMAKMMKDAMSNPAVQNALKQIGSAE